VAAGSIGIQSSRQQFTDEGRRVGNTIADLHEYSYRSIRLPNHLTVRIMSCCLNNEKSPSYSSKLFHRIIPVFSALIAVKIWMGSTTRGP